MIVSAPLPGEASPMPSVYVLPLSDMLVGVALVRVANPPDILKAKSAVSRAPVPFETA